jgi:archaemetzincin
MGVLDWMGSASLLTGAPDMNLWLPLLALAGLWAVTGNAVPLKIKLVAVGSLPSPLLSFLLEGLAQELGAVVEVAENLPLPASCPEGQQQYLGDLFLEALAAVRQSGDEVVVGVTGVDLAVPGLNFVFGLADSRNHTAVISLARLYPEYYGQPRNPRIFKERAIKEAIHEIGHLLGLDHCPDPVCIMFFSNSLTDTDRKGSGFCKLCRERLEK